MPFLAWLNNPLESALFTAGVFKATFFFFLSHPFPSLLAVQLFTQISLVYLRSKIVIDSGPFELVWKGKDSPFICSDGYKFSIYSICTHTEEIFFLIILK